MLPGYDFPQQRYFDTATRFGHGTAGVERASGGRLVGGRWFSWQDQALSAGDGFQRGTGGDEGLCIGMAGESNDLAGGAGLDDFAEVKHEDPMANLLDECDVWREVEAGPLPL